MKTDCVNKYEANYGRDAQVKPLPPWAPKPKPPPPPPFQPMVISVIGHILGGKLHLSANVVCKRGEQLRYAPSLSAVIDVADLLEYECDCVRPNDYMGIIDMLQLEEAVSTRGRKDLGGGSYVKDGRTADANCLICGGSGKLPRERWP